jgi:hypothetical protein
MEQYAGIDVSLKSASVCVVDASGRIMREAQVAGEPEALIGWFGKLEVEMSRIGLKAGPLSQWLYAGMRNDRFKLAYQRMSGIDLVIPVSADQQQPNNLETEQSLALSSKRKPTLLDKPCSQIPSDFRIMPAVAAELSAHAGKVAP